MDSKDAKQRLRREFGRRAPVAPAEAHAAAERIRDFLLADPAVSGASRFGLYAALPDEVSTRPLFDALTGAGRRCLFPRTLANGELRFGAVEHFDDLRPGRYGVPEPPETAVTGLDAGDVIVVPGLAFDRRGFRLGRGGGYYDRTFPPGESRQPFLIGATFSDRILESLPHDSHDRAMDAIVTERELRWTREIE